MLSNNTLESLSIFDDFFMKFCKIIEKKFFSNLRPKFKSINLSREKEEYLVDP